MAKKHERAGDPFPARPNPQLPEKPVGDITFKAEKRDTMPEDIHMTSSYGLRTQTPPEGVTVIGEAVRRVFPECAEFLVEIATSAPSAAQALRDNYSRTAQITEAVAVLGVQ